MKVRDLTEPMKRELAVVTAEHRARVAVWVEAHTAQG